MLEEGRRIKTPSAFAEKAIIGLIHTLSKKRCGTNPPPFIALDAAAGGADRLLSLNHCGGCADRCSGTVMEPDHRECVRPIAQPTEGRMVRDRQEQRLREFSQSRHWDGWLEELVAAMEATAGDAASSVDGRCGQVACPMLRQTVLAHLLRPAGAGRSDGLVVEVMPLEDISSLPAVYSPAICSRGRLPRSMPRSLASSRVM
ncbi:MAG: hypothetical protein WBA29_06965 [Xanthobacteraceae bacterium]